MLKTIKVSEQAYKAVRKLGKEMEKNNAIEGLYHVTLSTAIGFAANLALDEFEKRKRFRAAAGGWKNLGADNMLKEIYDSRRSRTRNLSFEV